MDPSDSESSDSALELEDIQVFNKHFAATKQNQNDNSPGKQISKHIKEEMSSDSDAGSATSADESENDSSDAEEVLVHNSSSSEEENESHSSPDNEVVQVLSDKQHKGKHKKESDKLISKEKDELKIVRQNKNKGILKSESLKKQIGTLAKAAMSNIKSRTKQDQKIENASSSEDESISDSGMPPRKKSKQTKESESDSSDSSSDSDAEIHSARKSSSPQADDNKVNSASSGDSDMEQDAEGQAEEMEEDEYSVIRKELADMPFEDLQKLKERLGMKLYNQAMFGFKSENPVNKNKQFKRENKNRPMEMSSKKPVRRFRETVAVKKKVHRDPRFDDLSGEYDETFFKNAYGFIGDVKQREKQTLVKKLKKEKDPEKKKQIEFLVQRMTQQEKSETQKEQKKQREADIKKKEKALVKEGKKPYYLKESEKRVLELAEKYKELQKSGKVENYLQKKRKKNAAKDRKKLPKAGAF